MTKFAIRIEMFYGRSTHKSFFLDLRHRSVPLYVVWERTTQESDARMTGRGGTQEH